MYIQCNNCGVRVSNKIQGNVVLRAWVECPECIAKNPKSSAVIDKVIKKCQTFIDCEKCRFYSLGCYFIQAPKIWNMKQIVEILDKFKENK